MAHDHDHEHGGHDHTHDRGEEDDRDHVRTDAAQPGASETPGCGHCRSDSAPGGRAADDHDHVHRHGAHEHAHTHDFREIAVRKLQLAFGLTVSFMFVEVAVGIYGRSLTLASDGGHMGADAGALLLALIAQRFALRRATRERTYGFRRAETLAAFVNGVALTGTALWVLSEAWERFRHPVPMRGGIVVVVGVLGLFVNLASAWILSRGTGHNLNTRAALAHVVLDAVGSIVAVTAGILSLRLHWYRVDPVLSVAMAGLILFGAWSILKGAAIVLMEGTPSGLDLAELEDTIRATPGVADLHDLHAWTISEGFDVITVHVVLDGEHHGTDVARAVGERIHAIHRVAHVTVQPEPPRAGTSLHPATALVHRSN